MIGKISAVLELTIPPFDFSILKFNVDPQNFQIHFFKLIDDFFDIADRKMNVGIAEYYGSIRFYDVGFCYKALWRMIYFLSYCAFQNLHMMIFSTLDEKFSQNLEKKKMKRQILGFGNDETPLHGIR